MSPETPAERRLRELVEVASDANYGMVFARDTDAAAIDMGREALALLRRLPEWDPTGECAFWFHVGECRGRGVDSHRGARAHDPNCPRAAVNALLARAGEES